MDEILPSLLYLAFFRSAPERLVDGRVMLFPKLFSREKDSLSRCPAQLPKLWYTLTKAQRTAMAETKATEITGTIKNVTFKNHETGYMVLKLDKNTTLCGVYHDTMAALEGARIKAVGEWKKHKAYGLQFMFQELTVLENELFYFLTRMVKGLGKNLASPAHRVDGGGCPRTGARS